MQAPISRTRYMQENRKMRFEEAFQGWSGGRLTQTEAARSMQAVAAQRYGSFLIEELIERTPGEPQVFESPDRGLDVDVPAVATVEVR